MPAEDPHSSLPTFGTFSGPLIGSTATPPRVRYVREFTLEGRGVNREEFEVDLEQGADPVDVLRRLRDMAEGTPAEPAAA